MVKFNYPVGYHNFHIKKIMNYQLNRWHSFGYARKEDCINAAGRIKRLEDFKTEMVRQAEKALAEQRAMNAAFYYRAAEFFVPADDPDKQALYEKFYDLFYHFAFKKEAIEQHKVPYQNTYLPVLRLQPNRDNKGVLLIHGGFDSFKEELISWAYYFIQQGYETIIFDGPGQGEALIKYHLPLTYAWEQPSKSILEYFGLEEVTILGVSMGGWLCFRVAAFEPRIKRVIASSVVFDYLQIPPSFIAMIAKMLLKYPKILDSLTYLQMKVSSQERWAINNLMHITKKDTPTDAAKELLKLNEENLHSEQVFQEVLILTGKEDHFIPLKMHHKQVAALKNANSVTERIFTRAENAQNHCQVGNLGLALDVMSSWLESKR